MLPLSLAVLAVLEVRAVLKLLAVRSIRSLPMLLLPLVVRAVRAVLEVPAVLKLPAVRAIRALPMLPLLLVVRVPLPMHAVRLLEQWALMLLLLQLLTMATTKFLPLRRQPPRLWRRWHRLQVPERTHLRRTGALLPPKRVNRCTAPRSLRCKWCQRPQSQAKA